MPRAISMQHTVVPSGERKEFRARARAMREHYADAGCRYWLYEEDALAGAYVEFYEASDKATLAKAHHARPDHALRGVRLYIEVELT